MKLNDITSSTSATILFSESHQDILNILLPGHRFLLEFCGIDFVDENPDVSYLVAKGHFKSVSELVLKKKNGAYLFEKIGKLKDILEEIIYKLKNNELPKVLLELKK